MTSMTEFLNIMDNLKVVLSEVNLKNEFGSLANKIDELTITNSNLSKKMETMKQEIEELETFKKNSIFGKLDKQVVEQKNQIAILEQQLAHYKSNTDTYSKKKNTEDTITKLNKDILERDRYIAILENKVPNNNEKQNNKENTTNNNKNTTEEEEDEYEIVLHKKKKFYLDGKKVYKINKDESKGDYYGRYKNGEVIKKAED
jgi:hypothetical protein